MKKIASYLLSASLALGGCASLATPSSASTPVFFSDTGSHWALDFVNHAYMYGLMSGKSTNTFDPDGNMTYGQFAVVIVNGAFQGTTTGNTGTHWSDIYLNTLLEKGLMKTSMGYDVVAQTSGWQDQAITREDAASIIARVIELSNGMTTGDVAEGYTTNAVATFSDVGTTEQTSGQAADIGSVLNSEIMIGSNQQFGVGTSMTRAEVCVVISSMLDQDFLKRKT